MSLNYRPLLIASMCTSIAMLAACQPTNNTKPADMSTKSVSTDNHSQSHAEHNMSMDMEADMSHVNEVTKAYMQGMSTMHEDMMAGMQANDADVAFAKGMLPHHVGAVDMAQVQLKYGKDETMRQLAKDIIAAQQAEIEQMKNWIAAHPDSPKQPNTAQMQQAYHHSMQSMHEEMMAGIQDSNPDMAFAKGMLPHHQGAVAMAEVQLKYGKDESMRQLAQQIIDAQQAEIELMQNWINKHA